MRLERATSRPQEGQDWLGVADKGSGEEQWKDVGSRLIYAQPRTPREGRSIPNPVWKDPRPLWGPKGSPAGGGVMVSGLAQPTSSIFQDQSWLWGPNSSPLCLLF